MMGTSVVKGLKKPFLLHPYILIIKLSVIIHIPSSLKFCLIFPVPWISESCIEAKN